MCYFLSELKGIILKNRITIFIAEDSPNVRANLKKIIALNKNLELIGETENVDEAIAFFSKTRPDLCIIDIGLTKGSGIDLLKYLNSFSKPPLTIIFTNYVSPPYRIICEKIGADYFLDKTKDFEKLHEIITNYSL